MGYKIDYSPDSARRYPQPQTRRWINTGKVCILLLVIAAALWLRLNGIPDFLIPGDPVVTRSAAAAFMDNVQVGMPMGEAVTTFCLQIINGAGL